MRIFTLAWKEERYSSSTNDQSRRMTLPLPSSQLPAGPGPGLPVTHVSLAVLVAEWNKLVEAKWAEIRQGKGHFISAYSPQWTMREDSRRRAETRLSLMAWTVEWFRERGHSVVCVPDENNTDGFGISLATAQGRT